MKTDDISPEVFDIVMNDKGLYDEMRDILLARTRWFAKHQGIARYFREKVLWGTAIDYHAHACPSRWWDRFLQLSSKAIDIWKKDQEPIPTCLDYDCPRYTLINLFVQSIDRFDLVPADNFGDVRMEYGEHKWKRKKF